MTTVNKKGTAIIIPAFTDEAGTVLALGDLISPVWSLTTSSGRTFINSRQNVPLTALYVTLTGADLAVIDNDLNRLVTFEAQYNSSTYGNGLYLKEEVDFSLKDLKKVQ